MELHQIEAYIDSPNPQDRMKAITELRYHLPSVVVPLLRRRMRDQEFIIRSFVAMGLGSKRTEEAFEALLDLIKYDSDPNVRAEAANSLAKYGQRSFPHLLQLFERDSHWLVRQSILAAMEGTNRPEIILQMCRWGVEGDDPVVRETAIATLGQLQGTPQEVDALTILLSLATSEAVAIRAQTARVLRHFDDPRAQAALMKLRQDSDYRVVGVTLEGLVQ
ncbi:HEAT repeat domain-containing protein [Pleurocapsales cyanobacterium LEGE 06147]|nr:HEAT repeat domain-containing protein [Pleurocapsales cyanobacterium LEGE 06147]